MKTCLICGATAQDNCATCPNCGEASWTAVAVVSKPAPEQSRVDTRIDVERPRLDTEQPRKVKR